MNNWHEYSDGTVQRTDGLLVLPGLYGGWAVSHPAGYDEDNDPVFPTREAAIAAADAGGPGIPTIEPGDEWMN